MKKLSLVFLVLAGFCRLGFGFPEMVRHGYVNCTTCHVSPNGGGTLTAYGRSLSEEVLSTWHREGEGQFAYGLLKTPDWVMLGGDFRELQLYVNNPLERYAQFILMQNDLEGAVKLGKFTADATLGYYDTSGSFLDHVISRRYFLMYQPTEQISLRAGRFFRAFGINTPDHIIPTKQGLGMDEGMETDNIEASWIGERFDVFLTGVFGRLDAPDLQREKGVALRSSVNFFDTYKTGLSYLYSYNDKLNRNAFGPYGILGITPHMFILVEADFQSLTQPTSAPSKFGLVSYLRADYEFIQGLHAYVTHEYQQAQFGDGAGTNAYGAGLQFFPRPHFEINGFIRHIVMMGPGAAASPTDMLALLLHFYP